MGYGAMLRHGEGTRLGRGLAAVEAARAVLAV
jgi:hypothetical protein